MAAPVGEVITPICLGVAGIGFFRAGSNRPSLWSLALSASKACWSAPRPAGSRCSTNPDLVSFPGQGADPLVGATEHGTPDLAFLIFEREIPVPGGWSGKAGEFPLNPDLHKA